METSDRYALVREGEAADAWLRRFIDDHPRTADLRAVCDELADALELAMANVTDGQRGMIVHVASFDRRDPDGLPLIFYVRDIEVQPDRANRGVRNHARDSWQVQQ